MQCPKVVKENRAYLPIFPPLGMILLLSLKILNSMQCHKVVNENRAYLLPIFPPMGMILVLTLKSLTHTQTEVLTRTKARNQGSIVGSRWMFRVYLFRLIFPCNLFQKTTPKAKERKKERGCRREIYNDCIPSLWICAFTEPKKNSILSKHILIIQRPNNLGE